MSPADLTRPFDPSCCEGGVCSSSKESARPCGCDYGANWLCEQHRRQGVLFQGIYTLYDEYRTEEWTKERAEMRHPELTTGGEPVVYRTVRIDEIQDGKSGSMSRMKKHLNEVVNKTWNFAGRITDKRGHQMNAMIGLASESGEALDILKKMHFHTEKEPGFYREKLVSELGDVLYYFLKTLDVFGISLKEVLKYNRKKLASRHPELGEVTERFGKDAIRG